MVQTGGAGSSNTEEFPGGLDTNLTTGSVAFAGASGTLTENNSNLFWDDSSKFLGIGIGAPLTPLHISTDTGATELLLASHTNTSGSGPTYSFRRSRGTAASPTVALNNDNLGNLNFSAIESGGGYRNSALIVCEADGAHGSEDTPGRLLFKTVPDGASGPIERMRIGQDGKISIGPGTASGGPQFEIKPQNSAIALGITNTGSGRCINVDQDVSSGSDIAALWINMSNTGAGNGYSAIFELGNVGIGITTPTSLLHINQSNASGALPVIHLEQDDVSEEFLRMTGAAAVATLTQSFVADADVTTPTLKGYFKINVQDEGDQITDGSYFVPFYSIV